MARLDIRYWVQKEQEEEQAQKNMEYSRNKLETRIQQHNDKKKQTHFNGLEKINEIIDNEFIINFEVDEDDDWVWTDRYLSVEEFEEEFDDFYSVNKNKMDLSTIIPLCNFNTAMKIYEYVCIKFEELDGTSHKINPPLFIFTDTPYYQDDDTMLKQYIYFYMVEVYKPICLEMIEELIND